MALSLILGRTGSVEEGTGLYLMEGDVENMHVMKKEVLQVADGPGIALSAHQAFREMHDVYFINKLDSFHSKKSDFLDDLADSVDMATGDWRLPNSSSLFTSIRNDSIAQEPVRLWRNETLGLAPFGRAVKVILKNRRTQSARAAVVATGVSPDQGGRTWIFSPMGFTSHKTPSIVADGGAKDLAALQSGNPDLFLVVTNAVVFQTGHRRRQPDEKHPRLLQYQINSQPYEAEMDQFLSRFVTLSSSEVVYQGLSSLMILAQDFSENGPASVDLFDTEEEDDGFLELEDEEML